MYKFTNFPNFLIIEQWKTRFCCYFLQTYTSILILFKHLQDAKFIDEIEDLSHVKKLVVVDSTWQQTKQMFRDEKLKGLPCVKIRQHKTRFWRYQNKGDDHLATIEGVFCCGNVLTCSYLLFSSRTSLKAIWFLWGTNGQHVVLLHVYLWPYSKTLCK